MKPGFHPNATHATQAIAFGWKPGLTQTHLKRFDANTGFLHRDLAVVGEQLTTATNSIYKVIRFA